MLQMASTDFVPIQPYKNTSVLVGIGQRYNVIVEANPEVYNKTDSLPDDGNYWIRTYIAPCRDPPSASPGYERTGILRYNSSSTANPSSGPWQGISLDCSDETYTSLHPILPWTVDSPINGPVYGQKFDLQLVKKIKPPPFPLAAWDLSTGKDGFDPIRINYSSPTFLNLEKKDRWDRQWRIVPENYTSEDWVSHPFSILSLKQP